MLEQKFFTAGKAVFTVEVPGGFNLTGNTPVNPHYTYRIKLKKGNPDGQWKHDSYFVQLLTGPDNTTNYTYLGKLHPDTGELVLTPGSKLPEDSWPVKIATKVLKAVWEGRGQQVEAAGWNVLPSNRCCRCSRPLTVPESVKTGIGPECASKM